MMQMSAEAVGFPAGKTPKGVSCADGDVCDVDGQRNGVCVFRVSLCLNVPTRACHPRMVKKAKVKAGKKSPADATALEAALAAIPLPTKATVCSAPALISVPAMGPGGHGRVRSKQVALKGVAEGSGHKDSDTYKLTCVPTTVGGGPTPTTTPVSSTTSTTTPITPPPPTPGAGLSSEITAATVSASGTVVVTFTLTDGDGNPVTPVTAATADPDQAQVAFTIARLELDPETQDGTTTTFTRYENYLTTTAHNRTTGLSSPQPTFDAGGTLATVDPIAGTYMYTFATTLPAGFPAGLTHTVGGQILRTFDGAMLVANPVFDFVPAGGPVTTVREVTTTDQCNVCHGQLAAHGGSRREVRLCQLCHTDQAIDPDTGNSLDFKTMAHKIHRGKQLPSLQGTVGAKYALVGFGQRESVFGEHVQACSGGAKASATCTTDADCPGGTCSADKMIGVGFPQDIRDCEK